MKQEYNSNGNILRITKTDNPSLMWLLFVPPFLLSSMGQGGILIGAACSLVVLAVILLIYRKRRHSWRLTLFLPVIGLLIGSFVLHAYAPYWQTTGTLLAIALSAGWLWRIEHTLSADSPIAIGEWLYSAKLFGIGSLGYLLLYQLWLRDFGWAAALPALLTVIGVVWHHVLLYRASSARTHKFCCPIGSPLVRMAIVKGNQIWLTNRPYTGCYMDNKESPCHLPAHRDHPLTSCVNPDETPEEALNRAYTSTHLSCEETPRFLVKYNYHFRLCSEVEKPVYLFVLNLNPNTQHPDLTLRGHFYSPEEVEKRIADGRFGGMLAEEYQYLKNTLIKANKLIYDK
ncbi:MAG: hypothetical protein Q4E10_02330 [Porphyromonas sp.]|nr:hypothetical protein [Porphyromonas sp.]